MKRTVAILFLVSLTECLYGGTIDGPTSVCPVAAPAYGTIAPNVYQASPNLGGACFVNNISNVLFEWTITGGVYYTGTNTWTSTPSGTGLYVLPSVYWTQTTGTHSITVKMTGTSSGGPACGTFTDVASLTVTLVVPGSPPPAPSSLSASNVKFCPGTSISLTASWAAGNPDPNADANANNNVVYIWEVSTNGFAGPFNHIGSTYSTTNSINYTLPAPSSPTASIIFRVYTKYSPSYGCWGNQWGTNLNESAPTYSAAGTLMAIPPTPTFGVCLDGTSAKIYLKSVSGTSLSSTYYVDILNIYSGGGFGVGGVITSNVSNYSAQSYNFYYNVGANPADGCPVSGTLPSTTDHTLTLGAAANCTAGLNVTSASGGTSPYTYSVNNGTYQSSTVFTGLGASTTNVVKAKDYYGCVGTQSNVQTFSLLSLNTPSTTPDCPGSAQTNGSITLSGAGGKSPYTYSVNGSPYQASGNFPSLANNTYTVSVKDSNGSGCTFSTTATVTNSPTLNLVSAVPNDPTCFGVDNGTITLNASGGLGAYEYSIDNGANFQGGNVFTGKGPNPPTPYVAIVRDDNNCLSNTLGVSLSYPAELKFTSTAATDQSCVAIQDGSISLQATGGTGARNYYVTIGGIPVLKGEGSPTVYNGLAAGNYPVMVEDANNCSKTTNVTVGIKPLLVGSIVTTKGISCPGSGDGILTASAGGGTSPYSYSWSNGIIGAANSGLSPGNYVVTITDSKGCMNTANSNLTEPQPLSLLLVPLDYSGFGISCNGVNDGSIDLTVTGGTLPYQYIWSNGSTSQDPSGISPGDYSVEVTDKNGCKANSGAVEITEPPLLTIALTGQIEVSCDGGTDGSITVSASGGAGTYEYSVDNVSWQSQSTITGLVANSYTVSVRDVNGCMNSLPATLTAPTKVQLVLSDLQNTLCGQANGAATVAASGGIAGYNYSWYDQTMNLIGSDATAQSLPAGSYNAEVTDANGCVENLNVLIGNSDGPVITVNSTIPPLCSYSSDGEVDLSLAQGTAPYDVTWLFNGNATSYTTEDLQNLPGGTYTAEVSDVNGCIDFEVIPLQAPQPISVSEQLQRPTCVGDTDGSIDIAASGGTPGYVFQWSDGTTGATLTSVKAGTYHVDITDTHNCLVMHDVILPDADPVIVDLGEDRTICVGQQVTLAPGLNGAYSWTGDNGFSSTAQSVTLNTGGIYKLVFTDGKGCVGQDEITIVTSTDLLKADFLMISEGYEGDTIAVIDISWPAPESIDWIFPTGTEVINEGGPYAEIMFNEAGIYTVTLDTHLADCFDSYSGQITILEGSRPNTGGRKSNQGLISEIVASPNPATEKVGLEVYLREVSPVEVRIVTPDGNILLVIGEQDSDHYTWQIPMEKYPSGMYYIAVRAGRQVKMVRLIKI